MPLLNDAKTCYVGTQPITKIYAGQQLVWGKVQMRVVQVLFTGEPTRNFVVEFSENENCADCAQMKSVYQWRYQQSGIWTSWQQFDGWRADVGGLKGYQYLSASTDTRLHNSLFELRINGTTEQITLDLLNAPNLGTIAPNLTC